MAKEPRDTWDEAIPKRWTRERPGRESHRRSPLVYSALLGLSVVAVVQLAPLTELDLPLTVSVLCFALAVPALSATVYIIQSERRSDYAYEVETRWTFVMDLAGLLLSLMGIAGLFWHLWWVAGVLFVLSGVAALAVFAGYVRALSEANADEIARDAGASDHLKSRE